MIKALKNPFFLAGLPIVICGFTSGLIGMAGHTTFGYLAPGFLIPGLVMMACGWAGRRVK